MNPEMTELEDREERSERIRFRVYWIASIFSIFVFVVLMYWAGMAQFPPDQFPAVAGLWIFSISAILSSASLILGFWGSGTSRAPITLRPLGPLIGMALFLEFGWSIAATIQMVRRILP